MTPKKRSEAYTAAMQAYRATAAAMAARCRAAAATQTEPSKKEETANEHDNI